MDSHRRDGHHAAAFDDERHVARLETEARLASELHGQAARRCAELLDGAEATAERVLDLGCGPGVAAVALAERFPMARVVAVDGSARMLRRAEALAGRHAVGGRVETRRMDLDGDLGSLGTADLVWLAMALHHAADANATLREVRQLLAPQGLLCVLERAEPTVVALAGDLGRPGLWDRLSAAWSAWSGRGRSTRPDELLQSAGLDVVDARTLRTTVTAPDDQATRTFVAEQLAAAVRALERHLEPADLGALRAWVDGPAAHPWGATVTCSRELLLARRPA